MVGTAEQAQAIAEWHTNRTWDPDFPEEFSLVGEGSQRAVYLHRPSKVVYKVGVTLDHDGCNRYEHQVLTRLRREGHDHAPVTTLHQVQVTDYTFCSAGVPPETFTRDIVAMPYLPEDGSVPHEGKWLPGMVDLNSENIHAHGGKLWLIDAGGL